MGPDAEPPVTPAPRYVAVARDLRNKIQLGEYPVGEMLPTELELCRIYEISRHTARDALRKLRDEGLIARRRGAGTTVVSDGSPPAFAQELGGMASLLQYARDAHLAVDEVSTVTLDEVEAVALHQPVGSTWLAVDGLRRSKSGLELAICRIYLRPEFSVFAEELSSWATAYSELIEARAGIRVARIEQEISAMLLDGDDAAKLNARRAGPALRTIRRYYDSGDRLILASDSHHPGDRFVYAQSYQREA